jgi:hypothetical protein
MKPAAQPSPTTESVQVNNLKAEEITRLVQQTMQQCIVETVTATVKAVIAEILPILKTNIIEEIKASLPNSQLYDSSPKAKPASIPETIKAAVNEIIPALKTSIVEEIQETVFKSQVEQLSPFQKIPFGYDCGLKRKPKAPKTNLDVKVLPDDTFAFLPSDQDEIPCSTVSDPPSSTFSSFTISSNIISDGE